MKKLLSAVILALGFAAGSAKAYTFSLPGLPTGELTNPSTFTQTFNSAVADSAATLNFVLNGYRSLDGNNGYLDVFNLTINDVAIGNGAFDLGGGGSSYWNGPGTVVSSSPGAWGGGTATFSNVLFNLNAGINTFTFAYSAPGSGNGTGQSLGDEAWGIASASVSAVPEPEQYAMLLAGFGLIGTIALRRNKAKSV